MNAEFFRAIPKVELHCHLLGAVRHETFAELAQKAKAPLTRAEMDDFYARDEEKPKSILRALDEHLRLASAPEVPALAEMPALKDFDMEVWLGIFAPAKTPPAIVERLNREISAAVNSPEVRAKFEENGARPGNMSVPQFRAFLEREQANYERIVRAANIRAE